MSATFVGMPKFPVAAIAPWRAAWTGSAISSRPGPVRVHSMWPSLPKWCGILL